MSGDLQKFGTEFSRHFYTKKEREWSHFIFEKQLKKEIIHKQVKLYWMGSQHYQKFNTEIKVLQKLQACFNLREAAIFIEKNFNLRNA